MAAIDMNAKVAFGEVVDVQQVRSRGVTRIVIEVPSEAHVTVTTLLFGKNAIVIPFYSSEEIAAKNIPGIYGVRTLGSFSVNANPPAVIENGRPVQATRSGPPAPPPPTARSVAKSMLGEPRMAGEPPEPRNYAANAAMLCGQPAFWQFLMAKCDHPVANEVDAAVALRAALGIETRRVLNQDPEAAQRFVRLRNEYTQSVR